MVPHLPTRCPVGPSAPCQVITGTPSLPVSTCLSHIWPSSPPFYAVIGHRESDMIYEHTQRMSPHENTLIHHLKAGWARGFRTPRAVTNQRTATDRGVRAEGTATRWLNPVCLLPRQGRGSNQSWQRHHIIYNPREEEKVI